jgi:hypothetical protein
MKSYLPLQRAADIASRKASDMALLCEANRIDCRKTNDDWFVAEEEIVNTLSMMNREVLDAELVDLRRDAEHRAGLNKLEASGQKLLQATMLVLLLLFGTMAVLTWGVNLAEHGNFAFSFDILNRNLAAIAGIWR